MGLLDRLTGGGILTNVPAGSVYSIGNGTTPVTNVGATKQSRLHADNDKPGYSLDGANAGAVSAAYQAYVDGYNNALPSPSLLDLNGKVPSNNYRNTAPTEGQGRI